MRALFICGNIGAGKTTFARELSSGKFVLFSACPALACFIGAPVRKFASPIREYVMRELGVSAENFERAKDVIDARAGVTVRQVMIDYATKMRATHGDDYFARAALQEGGGEYVIFDDFRFEAELRVAHELDIDVTVLRIDAGDANVRDAAFINTLVPDIIIERKMT